MELKPGSAAILRRTFTQSDFDRFAALSGDDNPIHVDPEFAARTRFGRTVCHGMLLYSTVCAALTREIGAGFSQYEQELMFVTPTYAAEEVVVRLEITALWPERGQADLSTVITRPDGSIACQGRTLVFLPGAPRSGVEGAAVEGGRDESPATRHKGLALGQSAGVERVFSRADLAEYVDLCGDLNPAYMPEPASGSQPAVPGGLLGGLFSFLLGTRLPGRGTNWLKQRLVFPTGAGTQACAGEAIAARVEVVRLRPDKDLVNLRTTCTAGDGRTVCYGEALVLVKDLEST